MNKRSFKKIPIGNERPDDAIRRYLINPVFILRGWKLLPYALQDRFSGMTRFYLKEQYDALLKCDGRTDIDPVQLDETTRNWYRHREENGMIARIRGKRQRKTQYNNIRKR